jgi:hypothetical protein
MKWFRAVVLAVAIVVTFAGGAVAGHLSSDVASYTGCLSGKDGALIKVRQGDTPSSPCTGGQIEIHFSGGDVTSIQVGDGLTGGGTNGAVSIGLDASFTLPQGCVAGDIVERTSSGWSCGTDDDTTYTAGTGLDLAGGAFSIEPDNYVVNGESCSTGQLVTGIDSTGHITCAGPPAAQPPALSTYGAAIGPYFDLAGHETVISVNAPAGQYLVFATVEAYNADHDSGSNIRCGIPNYQTYDVSIEADRSEVLSLTAPLTLAGGPIDLTCTETAANVTIAGASLHALKIG